MASASTDRGNMPLAILCLVAAVVFAAGAIFYATQSTDLLAGAMGRHYKHAILSAGLCVVALVAANFVRPKA
jgi:Na+/glutamate symporter